MKVLLYDLEITPILGWAYDMWDAKVIHVEREPYIMCFAYKWLGDGKPICIAQTDFVDYDEDQYSDYAVVGHLHSLMDEADIVVAHNARKFDNRVASARFLSHGFTPPSPYKTVDTLTAARRYFRFGSNSLSDLCHRLGIGEKSKTRHHELWRDCVEGDLKAWRQMKLYCIQDVVLLEGLYNKLLPYISNHPNVSVGKEYGCPRCGSLRLQHRGFYTTNVSKYHRLYCNDCGSWSRERIAEKEHPMAVTV